MGYNIYRYNRLAKGWLFLIFAFILQGIRRIIVFLADYGKISQLIGSMKIIDYLLMFFISFFIVIGLWVMWKNFENFDIVEKKVKKRIRSCLKKMILFHKNIISLETQRKLAREGY